MVELGYDMLGTARAPLSFTEDGNITEHTGPGATARGLHGGKPLQGQDRGDVERHRLDEVQWEAISVGKWPLVEVAIQRPVGIVNELAVLDPGDSGNAGGVVQSFYEVQNQLFPVAPAHEIDFGTL